VATKFVDKFERVKLPETSFYSSIKNVIEHQPDEIPLAVKPDAYAHEVLRLVERGRTGKAWVGGGAWMAKFSYWLSPEWAIVSPHSSTIFCLRRYVLMTDPKGLDHIEHETA
jgi:hypothetical protein